MKTLLTTLLALCLIVPVFAGEWANEVVDSEGDVGRYSSLALDSSDNPHISYFDQTNCDLKYACWGGFNWQMETVDSVGHVGWYTSLALDSAGNPHISYYDATFGNLKYARWDGSSWQIETVDGLISKQSNVGYYTSLALDSSDYPHISYHDVSNGNLKYTNWDGAAWQTETVDGHMSLLLDVGLRSSLALDSSDYPHISYHGYTNEHLKYARWDGSSWHIEAIDDIGDYTQISLALNSLDLPHISYLDGNYRNLKYARWDGFTWQIETVDSSGSVGYNASLALDSSDNPHIAYKDLTNNNLKYTLWDGSIWIFETTVGNGPASRPSLTLDSSDKPYISFLGLYNNNYAMMYAWINNPPENFSLLSPINHKVCHSWPLADWEDSTDGDGHSITYDLWYSTEADFSPYEEITGLTDSEYQFGDAELDENNIYFWKVLATDSYHETWSNQTDWWFYMG